MTETLYLLIPLSVVLVFLIGIAFWWSLQNGQFDDLEGPAYRILMDDDRSASPSPSSEQASASVVDVVPDAQPGKSAAQSSAANLRES